MKTICKRLLAAVCATLLMVGVLSVPTSAAETTHTVWVVGDSTACHYDPAKDDVGFLYKRVGYGDKLGEYLAAGYTVKNIALSGRSSRSFATAATNSNGGKESYDDMMSKMQPGDILIVGFGHNDEKTDDRYTSPTGDYQTNGSFAKSLYDYYVAPVKAKGAIPVICTPIVRHPGVSNGTLSSWSNSQLHKTNGGDYAAAALQMCQDTGTAAVDLTGLTKALYESLGADSTKLHAASTDEVSSMDATHINGYGAKWVSYLLAKSITESTDANVSAALKGAFTLAKGEPTAADYTAAATAGWTKPAYTAPKLPEEKSALWADFTVGGTTFYGTAFGSIGGAPTTDNLVIEPSGDGAVHLGFKNLKGKCTNGEEGFLMYFVPIPATSTFKLTARATYNGAVDASNNPGQAAFGLMARDAVWMDVNNKSQDYMSDYVVAGTFGDASANCFLRKGTTITKSPKDGLPALQAGQTFDMEISSTTDGYSCRLDSLYPARTGGYDFKLTAKDPDYIYVGMMTSRNIDVTYDNIYLEVDGKVWADTRTGSPGAAFTVEQDGWKAADGKLVSVTGDMTGNATKSLVFAATYSADGALTGFKSLGVRSGEVPVDLPLPDGGWAKLFVLGKSDVSPTQPAQHYPAEE